MANIQNRLQGPVREQVTEQKTAKVESDMVYVNSLDGDPEQIL